MTLDVALHPAYRWCCPLCGQNQFERSVALDRAAAIDQFADAAGRSAVAAMFDDGVADFALAPPDVVTCRACGRTFETTVADEAVDNG